MKDTGMRPIEVSAIKVDDIDLGVVFLRSSLCCVIVSVLEQSVLDIRTKRCSCYSCK